MACVRGDGRLPLLVGVRGSGGGRTGIVESEVRGSNGGVRGEEKNSVELICGIVDICVHAVKSAVGAGCCDCEECRVTRRQVSMKVSDI